MSVPTYEIHHTKTPPALVGNLEDMAWSKASLLSPLVNLDSTDKRAVPQTNIKLLYDDTRLYIGAFMHEPHVWATITEQDSVIFHDNDFEVFIDADGSGCNYYEFETNAFGTTWQLSLNKPYHQGGHATSPHHLPSLKYDVKVDGKINDATNVDKGWGVCISIEFEDLKQFGACIPVKGCEWRMNFSRVQWQHRIVEGKYERVPPRGTELPQGAEQWHPEQNCVWASTNVMDIHRPQLWGVVKFV